MTLSTEFIIEHLMLRPLEIEGGYFRETYRSPLVIPGASVGAEFKDDRSVCTAIYYLLTPSTFSELHRLPGDEIFHFYLGDPVEMLQLHPDGSATTVRLGNNLRADEVPQTVVPGGVWQGARLVSGGNLALLGCTVAPGFDYADYTSGRREELIARYPDQAALVERLTRH